MQRFHVARDLCASNNLEVFGGHDIAPEPIGAVKTLAPLGAPLPRGGPRGEDFFAIGFLVPGPAMSRDEAAN